MNCFLKKKKKTIGLNLFYLKLYGLKCNFFKDFTFIPY